MRVLGVDPGSIKTGWGVLDVNGSRMVRVDSGVLRVGRGEVCERLARIHQGLTAILSQHRPDYVSLERNFVARNVQSAFRLGEARGVVMAAAAAAGVALCEYAPMSVKKSVAGYGGADKAQVQGAVVALLGLDSVPAEDEADALAAAVCHAVAHRYDSRVQRAVAAPAPRSAEARARVAALAALHRRAAMGRRS
jgi:crossover junction endodeoxyribonuclease RuvC